MWGLMMMSDVIMFIVFIFIVSEILVFSELREDVFRRVVSTTTGSLFDVMRVCMFVFLNVYCLFLYLIFFVVI